jgi:protein-S-isoprenylcysteine O-methyltransferase Ste14
MMAIAAVGALIVLAAALFWHARVAPRQSPQAIAFTTTFAAALFLITGSIGFGLQKGPALLSPARWSNSVIWPQVILGVAFLIAAVICWRRAIRDVDRRLGRP